MNDRLLPHSDEIEQAVIGALMTEPELQAHAMKLDAEDFHNPNFKRCAASIRQAIREDQQADLITVCRKAPDLEPVIFDAMNAIATTANFESWFRQLKLLTAQRTAIQETYNFYNTMFDAEDILKLINGFALNLSNIYEQYQLAPERPKTLVKNAYSSGFFTYDYNDGGFQGGKRIVFKGAKNQGKTTLSKMMLYAMALQGQQVFYFSGEREKEYEECDLALLGADKNGIQHRQGIAGRNEYYPTSKSLEDYKNGVGKNITVIDRLGAGKQNMFDYVAGNMEKAAQAGCRFYALDNMAILNSGASGKNKFAHQEQILNYLDTFKQKYDADIVLIVHPKKGKGFESTSGLGEIENLCDTLIRFIRLTDNQHIVDTENYMLKSKALANTNFPDFIKEKITAIMTFEKVKKGTKYTAYFEWEPERGISREVSMYERAAEYQKNGFWVRHIHKYGRQDIPKEQAEQSRTAYKD